jgi:hypothetical protein
MNAEQANALQRAGQALAWAAVSAVGGSLTFVFCLIRSNHGYAVADGVAKLSALLIVASLGAAFVILLVGVVRWPRQVLRSLRWLFSALAIVLVAVAVLFFVLMTITAAIALS